MRLSIVLIAGLATCWASAGLTAATVTVDKPSPPAGCADGVCYPKKNTWGYYPGQWRRWPGEGELEPTPAEPMARPVPGIPPYETPTPQEEDRRAPPPTKPAERSTPNIAPPAVMPTPTTSEDGQPTAPSHTPPPRGMLPGTPPEGSGNEGERPAPRMPWEQPTSEWDPPPSLPFGTADVDARGPKRSATRPVGPQLRMPNEPQRRSSAADGPPQLPLALGSPLH